MNPRRTLDSVIATAHDLGYATTETATQSDKGSPVTAVDLSGHGELVEVYFTRAAGYQRFLRGYIHRDSGHADRIPTLRGVLEELRANAHALNYLGIPKFLAEWAEDNHVPVAPYEPVGSGPWAEWDEHREQAVLAQWTQAERCPRCGQGDRPNAGLVPPPGFDSNSWQHGCGEWWSPEEVTVSDPTISKLDQALQSLRDSAQAARDAVRRQLRNDLLEFLKQPKDEREETGSETEPGIYRDGHLWTAWDYDPTGTGDTITVDDLNLIFRGARW